MEPFSLKDFDRPLETGVVYLDEASKWANEYNVVEYYWVKLATDYERWLTKLDEKSSADLAAQWCLSMFGPSEEGPSDNPGHTLRRWFKTSNRFCFFSEADYTLFLMRWS
jgi:hypothetical protein